MYQVTIKDCFLKLFKIKNYSMNKMVRNIYTMKKNQYKVRVLSNLTQPIKIRLYRYYRQ
jgi:hypothetical protein